MLELRPSRKRILAHLGERIKPSSDSPARGPPNNWGEFTQVQDERDAIQVPPDELPAINIHGPNSSRTIISLWAVLKCALSNLTCLGGSARRQAATCFLSQMTADRTVMASLVVDALRHAITSSYFVFWVGFIVDRQAFPNH